MLGRNWSKQRITSTATLQLIDIKLFIISITIHLIGFTKLDAGINSTESIRNNWIWISSEMRNDEGQFSIIASIWQPEIIVKRGYPVEIHSVTTKDGYILELHRIPPQNRENASKIVFLQHGLLDSSAAWIINPTNQSLGKLDIINWVLPVDFVYFKQLFYSRIRATTCGLATLAVTPTPASTFPSIRANHNTGNFRKNCSL